MKYITWDFTFAENKDQVQDIIVESMKEIIPDYYGRNLDALHDVLTSLNEDLAIDIDGAGTNPEVAGYINKLAGLIADVVDETSSYKEGRILSVDELALEEDDE